MGLQKVIITFTVTMVILHTQSTPFKRSLSSHVCDGVVRSQVINTSNGSIMCLKPTDQELETRMEFFGGMNKNYFANSMQDARNNFKNMFGAYGLYLNDTEQWKNWVNNVHSTTPYVDRFYVLRAKAMERIRESSLNQVSVKRLQRKGRTGVKKLEFEKRSHENNGNVSIQCLPGGRTTAKGIHLCPACQRCTELPANYYPRYVNELSCDSSSTGDSNDTKCFILKFIKIGKCNQVTMTFNVLSHTHGNYETTFQNSTLTIFKEKYEPTPHEVKTCCECMVFSALDLG